MDIMLLQEYLMIILHAQRRTHRRTERITPYYGFSNTVRRPFASAEVTGWGRNLTVCAFALLLAPYKQEG